jgi:hypothetical protein
MPQRQILVATISLFLWMLCVPSLSAACRVDPAASSPGGTPNIYDGLAVMPLPKMSAEQALAIAKAEQALDIANEMKRNPPLVDRPENYAIVEIEWCKSSNFQPSFDDGASHVVWDDPEAYAWVVTYLPAVPPPKGILRNLTILRIQENRKVDTVGSIRV